MKYCTKCKAQKDESLFYKDKSRKDGLSIFCSECIKDKNNNWIKNNRDKYLAGKKRHYNKYKTKLLEQSKKWQKDNKKKAIKSSIKYQKKRKQIDILFSFKEDIRRLILISIKHRGYTKKTKTFKILGIDYLGFMEYIESKFKEGMTFKNHGLWEFDHIIPISKAKTEEDIIRLNHYTNFQPLWKKENRDKRDKIF